MVARADQREALKTLCADLGVELITVEDLMASTDMPSLPEVDESRRAMMLFTSGTTNKPKGVVWTHASLRVQITTLLFAWEWSESDVIPLFLPLHHIHGIINVLSCALWAGATVHLFSGFDANRVCGQVRAGVYSVFMAVPTIYVKLLQHFDTLADADVKAIADGFASMRLNISGSAACPVKLFNQWYDLTGQVLLERYGMTEIGMGISNPYRGERRAGFVGQPLPGVEIQLFNDYDEAITEECIAGEIRVKGDGIFLEYWDNPNATASSFKDGWFRTGDVAVVESGYYRIMGRSSVDIIKSGGYKLSALEIEGVLLTHPDIAEVAVLGIADDTWGEAVTAFVVTQGEPLELAGLKQWCKERMSAYKVPKRVVNLQSLPRNAMGKVTKPALRELL
jgi:malonyl-CoA/methylmalonyl-CoA synthetase